MGELLFDTVMPSILVLGVGNTLLKDEGTGVEVVRKMSKMDLPKNVTLIDGATAGFDLMPYFEDFDYVIIVDVVNTGSEVGAIYRFTPDDVKSMFGGANTSLHQIGIIDVWNMVKGLKNKVADTTIIAVEPKVIDWGTGLTDEIKAKIPELIGLVIEKINEINNKAQSGDKSD